MRILSALALICSLATGAVGTADAFNLQVMDFTNPMGGVATMKVDTEFRADLTNSIALTNPGPSVTTTSTGIVFNVIRPRISGKLTDDLSYVVRADFTQLGSVVTRDGTTDMVNVAFLDYKYEGILFRLGKQTVLSTNGWETNYYKSDAFTYSTTFLNENAKYNYYRTGASASRSFEDQNFTLSVTNGTKVISDTSAVSSNNNGLGYGVAYIGGFFNRLIQPLVSYTLFQIDGNPDVAVNTNSVNDTLLAVGLRVNPTSQLRVDLDYQNLNQPIQNPNTQINNQLTTTLRGEATYRIPITDTSTLVPLVNVISDRFTGYGTVALPNGSNFTKMSYDAGLLYYPFKDTNFRYELMYSYASQTNDSSATTSGINTTNIRLGLKFDL